MKLQRSIPGIVHWHCPDRLVRSRGLKLEISFDNGLSFRALGRIPMPLLKRLATKTKLGARLLRTNVKHCLPVADQKWIVFCGKSIFRIDEEAGSVSEIAALHGSRPLRICLLGDSLFYGEYCSNPERVPIRLWRSDDCGQSWVVAYTFENIRHIHGVFQDPIDGSIWVTTGDDDHESAIWRSPVGEVLEFQAIVSGSQQTRVIDLLFTENAVYFGSDAPHQPNFIYRFNRVSGEIEKLNEVGGTVFHGSVLGGNLYFSTACEPSEVNSTEEVELWYLNPEGNFEKIWVASKDLWHMKYFQYGQILLPAGPGVAGQLWASPFATNLDQQSCFFEVSS